MLFYSLLVVPLLGGAFFLVRNEWVYRQRLKLLHFNYELYRKLPSYETMFWRIWIWDVRKFFEK